MVGVIGPDLCVLQSEDTGAVCGLGQPGEGSASPHCPHAHLCCPLQSASGTTMQAAQSWMCFTKVKVLLMIWSSTLTSAPGFYSGVPGSGGGASPPAVPAFSGPGEQQSTDALPGCRGTGQAGPGGRGPWIQCVHLPALLRQVLKPAARRTYWSDLSSKYRLKTKERVLTHQLSAGCSDT